MINTKIFRINSESIDKQKLLEAAKILQSGGVVAFPTETVYGLGGNALDEKAVEKIFTAKGRPSDNPLIVHLSKFEDINKLCDDIPAVTKILADRFWPGPLTMIVPRSLQVPDIVTAGLDTVAIRIPSHPIANTLIELAGLPIAAPSANLSGKPSPTNEEHVIEDLMGRVDAIVCGGYTKVGVESTVLDITSNPPMILRPGGVTKEEIEEVIGQVSIDPSLKNEVITPKSPGMKYTHYAPRADVLIVKGELKEMINKINTLAEEREEQGLRVGIMATDETINQYSKGEIISVGSRRDLKTVATNLFKVLREFDKRQVDIILSEGFEEVGIGQAIMNRLTKAAGYNIINL